MAVKTGLTVMLEDGLHRDEAIGLITNHTGVGPDLSRNLDLLLERGYRVRALFSPEHGVYGDHPDGLPVHAQEGPPAGIPVFSLYSDDWAPTQVMLEGLDVLIFDIQDIGARYYTYPTTMLLAMESAHKHGIPFTILDRPNPLGGVEIEGNIPDADALSFVCCARVPIRHGLTVGELAIMVAAEKGLPRPEVVRVQGWRRDMHFGDTGLAWVPPSPGAPTLDMAILYPGTCLIEGTNLSEGRGTSLPFQLIGAPWVDPEALSRRLRAEGLSGVMVRPVRFHPTSDKWAGQQCGGVQFHVTQTRDVRPVELGVRLLFALRDLHPDRFLLQEPQEAGRRHLDLLTGGPALRRALAQDDAPSSLLAGWKAQSTSFEKRRSEFLLYE